MGFEEFDRWIAILERHGYIEVEEDEYVSLGRKFMDVLANSICSCRGEDRVTVLSVMSIYILKEAGISEVSAQELADLVNVLNALVRSLLEEPNGEEDLLARLLQMTEEER